MPKPSFDPSTGWFSIRVRMPDGRRRKFMLAKLAGWAAGKKAPKRVPPEIELLARRYQDMDLQIRHGVDVAPARAEDLTTFLAEYQRHHAAGHRPNSVRILRQTVGHFLEFCRARGVVTAPAVTVTVCEDYLATRAAAAARATVAVEKGCLSPAWTRAVRARRLTENPWKLARTPGRPAAPRTDYWSEEELGRIVAAATGWVRDLILVAVNTGGRITSILNLRWRDVDLGRGVVRYDLKTAAYEVPLSAAARAAFGRRRAESATQHVFPVRAGDRPRRACVSYVAIRRAVRRAGVPEKGRYNHILRHTFASHAVIRGVPLPVVSKWLGHSTIAMTMRYSHLAPSESQRQMEGFSLGLGPAPGPAGGAKPPPGGG